MQEIMPVPTSRNEAPVTTSTNKSAQAADEIYIGFQKGDYAPRTGRKGRVIRDDPSKYPAKEDVGFLPGATGRLLLLAGLHLACLYSSTCFDAVWYILTYIRTLCGPVWVFATHNLILVSSKRGSLMSKPNCITQYITAGL